jgi:DNA helicase II / ATP-dependent DNA helicase PcrA
MAVLKSTPSIQPDPQQRQAIEHVHGPMLVLAGAGTGKTTVLIRRIAQLICDGHARPDEILALTYTENAAKEMLERAKRELRGSNSDGLQVCTFHAYCNELLKRCARGFDVLLDKDLWILLRRNLRDLHLNYYIRAANTAKFLDDLLEFMRRCQDELVGPEQYAEYVRRIENGELPVPRVAKSKDADEITDEEAIGRCREIASVFETVERMLRERNLGTFGHMILRANELLAEDQALLERERTRAQFILIDEFQDANYAQIKVLEKLAGPVWVGHPCPTSPCGDSSDRAPQNIFAVGDPDQGIYRFRGASSGAFELFQKHFAGSKLVVLTKNRRSTTPILKCAHALISQNAEFSLNAPTTPHSAEEISMQYRRVPLISARDEQDTKNATRRPPVDAVLVSSNFMEATDLVSTLIERRRQSRCGWKDIAILYRMHHHRDELAGELARNNIPFSIEGMDVLDTTEVRDLLACLGALVADTDSAALFRVSALQQFSVDPKELRSALRALPRDNTATIASVLSRVKGGDAVVDTIQQAREQSAGNKTHSVLLSLVRRFQIPCSPATNTILEFSNQWENSPITKTAEPAEFLEYLDYFREARGTIPLPAREEEDAVKLMTVHSAKGLEFDHVFILRAIKGSFPLHYREPLIELPVELRNSGVADQDEKKVCEQEERRLFYVAMTRARDTLSIYGQFGRGQNDKTPPGYLRELLKHREVKGYLKQRTCREFQTDIFRAAEPVSRLVEWIGLPPSSDLAATLSASAIQHYETCPLQFKLEREWRIPAEASAALQYGACMHRVLLTYYDSVRWDRTLPESELIELFRNELAGAGFTDHYQRELYEQKGITELREFIAASGQVKPEVLHTEERFSVKIGPTTLVGRIDRIDRALDRASDRVTADAHVQDSADGATASTVIVTDYKTGRPRSQEDADESLQLSLYALGAREKWGYHAERLVFHNLEGNTTVSTERTNAQLDEARLHVEEIAGKIAAGKFDPTPGFHCSWCAYRVLCPKTEKRVQQERKPATVQASSVTAQ